MSNFKAKKYFQTKHAASPWLMIPFILTLTVIPFILGMYQFDDGLGDNYWSTTTTSTDIFNYYKSFYIVIMGVIMALIFAIYRFSHKKPFNFGRNIIPLYVYIGCIVLSTIFSTEIYYSIHGIDHHFESTFVLLTYCLLVLYSFYFIDNERSMKWFINGFLIGTALLALFGCLQYSSGIFKNLYDNGTLSTDSGIYSALNKLFGCAEGRAWYEKLDPFNTQAMADYVYLPYNTTGKLSLVFPLGQVYLTLSNPNYVAFFTILTAPFFGTLAFYQEKLWKKIVFGGVTIGSIICLIGSQSVAGFFSLGISVVILIVAFRKKIFKKWIPWLISIGILFIALIGFDFMSHHSVTNRIQYVANKISSGFEKGYHNEDTVGIRQVTSSKDGIAIDYNGNTLIFTMSYDAKTSSADFQLKDSDGNILKTISKADAAGKNSIYVDDERFIDKIKINPSNINGIPAYCIAMDEIATTVDGQANVIQKPMKCYVTNQIHKFNYSYSADDTDTPLKSLDKYEDDNIGTYYSYTPHPKADVEKIFQSFVDDIDSLKTCFKQLKTITTQYTQTEDLIFGSDNPASEASNFFTQLMNNPDSLNSFLHYMSLSSELEPEYYYYNQTGKWTQIGMEVKTAIFTDYPKLASNRGYIWSRAIPVMFKDVHTALLGTGPDTYIFNFPHYDYTGLYRCGFAGQIITKPHSLYLQVATQTGIISALAIIALYILYLISCIKLYWNTDFATYTSKISVAILASVSGYMVAGIANDSTVSYSFVFWGLIGVGFAANRLEQKHLIKEQEELERKERLKKRKEERKAKKQNKNTPRNKKADEKNNTEPNALTNTTV